MSAIGWVLLVIFAIAIIVALYVMSVYNSLVLLRNDTEEGFSTMDVYLKKRYDLIPNIVETVKGYAKHEKETLQNVIQARNMAMNATTLEEKAKSESVLTGTLKSLFAVVENYPELKANTNFLDLQEQLKKLEEDIANARKYYNGVVKTYNNKVEVFPSNIIARWFKFTKKQMFEIENKEERQNVKVEF